MLFFAYRADEAAFVREVHETLVRMRFTGVVYWHPKCPKAWVNGEDKSVMERARSNAEGSKGDRVEDGRLEAGSSGDDRMVENARLEGLRVEIAQLNDSRGNDSFVEDDRPEGRQLKPKQYADKVRAWSPHMIITISLTWYLFKAFLAWIVLQELGTREILWTI